MITSTFFCCSQKSSIKLAVVSKTIEGEQEKRIQAPLRQRWGGRIRDRNLGQDARKEGVACHWRIRVEP